MNEVEVHVLTSDAGNMLSHCYDFFADDMQEANLKWSQVKEFRLKLPDGYLVDPE